MLRVDLTAPLGGGLRFAARFALDRGDVLALHGPSGAGKTTLLRAIAGLVPAEGHVALDGQDYRGLPAWRRPIGWVPQRQGLIPHWTPREHLRALGPALSVGIDEALERLDLARLRDRPARQLSFGERQRLALGRAIFTPRPLLLLDEPFSALDAAARLRMGDLVLERLRAQGGCAVLATHDLYEVQRLCGRLCLIEEGRVVAQGETADIVQRPPSSRAALLVGYHVLRSGLALHPARAQWREAPGLTAVQGTVERILPRDFGWRLELRSAQGEPYAADLPGGAQVPQPGEAVQVFFPDLRPAQSGDGE